MFLLCKTGEKRSQMRKLVCTVLVRMQQKHVPYDVSKVLGLAHEMLVDTV